ncbi:DUF6924 domain-containing protein [Paeniglutamicibacter cryotolerans]|uniref:DUF6924 domain-containing protein n=1 Tax=Paeniglutamicibacter cryotolerans TaxID=670079 RepID=A0A839QD96_9MICC|nr:hypothetical protein [Paeniglutamicibacter cryotolerans]MBB2994138.1 hypothetical protein [Paeniglutamicibacter cryotolerans]
MKMLPKSGQSLLVRTDFSDQAAWQLLAVEAEAENEDGCMAHLDMIDDPAFIDAAAPRLRAAVPTNEYGASVLFAADLRTLTEEGSPVIVIALGEDPTAFRCAVSELWAVGKTSTSQTWTGKLSPRTPGPPGSSVGSSKRDFSGTRTSCLG